MSYRVRCVCDACAAISEPHPTQKDCRTAAIALGWRADHRGAFCSTCLPAQIRRETALAHDRAKEALVKKARALRKNLDRQRTRQERTAVAIAKSARGKTAKTIASEMGLTVTMVKRLINDWRRFRDWNEKERPRLTVALLSETAKRTDFENTPFPAREIAAMYTARDAMEYLKGANC